MTCSVFINRSSTTRQLMMCLSRYLSTTVFMESKSLISPYFVASDALNVVEGIPRNSSVKSSCVFVFMLLALSSMIL
jgi:hypothetical protein